MQINHEEQLCSGHRGFGVDRDNGYSAGCSAFDSSGTSSAHITSDAPKSVDLCRAQAARDTAAQLERLMPGTTRAPELERYLRAKLCLHKAVEADEAELLKTYHPKIDDQLARTTKVAR